MEKEKTRQDIVKALMQCYDLKEYAEKKGFYVIFKIHIGKDYGHDEDFSLFDIWLVTQGPYYEHILHVEDVRVEDVDSEIRKFYDAIKKHKNQ